MAELADALVSGTSDSNIMQVQVLFSAPTVPDFWDSFLYNSPMQYRARNPQTDQPPKLTFSVREIAAFMSSSGDLTNFPTAAEAEAGREFEVEMITDLLIKNTDLQLLSGRASQEILAQDQGLAIPALHRELSLEGTFCQQDLGEQLEIRGRADALLTRPGQIRIIEFKSTHLFSSQIPRDGIPEHRMQLWLYGQLLAERLKLPDDANIELELIYGSSYEEAETRSILYQMSSGELRQWFRELWQDFARDFRILNPYRPDRFQTLVDMHFPYPEMRPQQKTCMRTVARFLHNFSTAKSERDIALLLEAPTGMGKTISTLYPALSLVKTGALHGIFYATAMTTTRQEVIKALDDLRKGGLRGKNVFIRSLCLESKYALCLNKTMHCDLNRCPYAKQFFARLRPALIALAAEDAIDGTNLRAVGEAYQVCPHELAMIMAQYCHVLIGDYNHVFSPSARLSDFLSAERRVALLIDEAHNLPERARAIYSAELSLRDIISYQAYLETGWPAPEQREAFDLSFLKSLMEKLAQILEGELNQDRARQLSLDNPLTDQASEELCFVSHDSLTLRTRPEKLEMLIEKALSRLKLLLQNLKEITYSDVPMQIFFKLKQLKRILNDYYNDDYVTSFTKGLSDEAHTLSLSCLGIREQLAACFAGQHPAVFFSATLSPMSFYRQLLFKESARIQQEFFDSPFPPEQRRILIHSGIDMRYAARAESLSEVIDLLERLVNLRRQNILVFCPSWQYLEDLKKAIEKTGPLHYDLLFQERIGDEEHKRSFVQAFGKRRTRSLLAFAVLGSVFNEGIDLPGQALETVVILSVAHPPLSLDNQLLEFYYDLHFSGAGKYFSYACPAFNRIQQAVGRLIRREEDRGLAILVDQRWQEEGQRQLIPENWQESYCQTSSEIIDETRDFFQDQELGLS